MFPSLSLSFYVNKKICACLSLSKININNLGQHVPNKATLNGSTCTNGSIGPEGPETTETDSSGTGGMRKSLERKGSAPNDAVHLQRRVGLFSGVALIVGTMIGKFSKRIFKKLLKISMHESGMINRIWNILNPGLKTEYKVWTIDRL